VPIEKQEIHSLKTWILEQFGDPEPFESDYRPGTAYKRISLPLPGSGSLHSAVNSAAMTQSYVALKLLFAKMHDIFETVEPVPPNLQTYGHKIRELLLVASMEVEASWAAVLKANGYVEDRYTTRDYVKLLAPMLLDSFSLELRSYPGSLIVVPFSGWTAQSPTQSLDWYHAYNQTKHNREECLCEATLGRAVNAVGAAAVMFYAQYGYGSSIDDEQRSLIPKVFTLKINHSMYPFSYYIPRADGQRRAWEWDLLNYPFS